MKHSSVARYSVAWLCIAVLIHLLIGFSIELSVDEAHYVLYAKHMAWSYFDHPPLVGWAQWPLVQLTSTAGLIRLLPECLWAVSLVLVYQNTKALGDWMEARAESNSVELPSPEVSEWLAVIGISLALLPHLLAFSLLPDTLLTTLSLGLMLLSLRWVNQQEFNGWHWLLLGLLLGLAGLSKYTAVFPALAVALVFIASDRKIPFDSPWPWIALAIAAVLVSPVFYWNATHDWMSFKYQLAHGKGDAWQFHKLLAFGVVQTICFGPLMIYGACVCVKRYRTYASPVLIALLCFFLLPFGVFAALSGSGGLPHWTTPAWFCLAPFAGVGLAFVWEKTTSRVIQTLAALQALLFSAGVVVVFSGGVPFTHLKPNPFADVYGWENAGLRAKELAQSHGTDAVAVKNWSLASRVAWYAYPATVYVIDNHHDQFELWFGRPTKGQRVVFVRWSELAGDDQEADFESCEPLESLQTTRFDQALSRFDFSLCTFK